MQENKENGETLGDLAKKADKTSKAVGFFTAGAHIACGAWMMTAATVFPIAAGAAVIGLGAYRGYRAVQSISRGNKDVLTQREEIKNIVKRLKEDPSDNKFWNMYRNKFLTMFAFSAVRLAAAAALMTMPVTGLAGVAAIGCALYLGFNGGLGAVISGIPLLFQKSLKNSLIKAAERRAKGDAPDVAPSPDMEPRGKTLENTAKPGDEFKSAAAPNPSNDDSACKTPEHKNDNNKNGGSSMKPPEAA